MDGSGPVTELGYTVCAQKSGRTIYYALFCNVFLGTDDDYYYIKISVSLLIVKDVKDYLLDFDQLFSSVYLGKFLDKKNVSCNGVWRIRMKSNESR